MTKGLKIVLTIGFMVFLQQFVKAQIDQNQVSYRK